VLRGGRLRKKGALLPRRCGKVNNAIFLRIRERDSKLAFQGEKKRKRRRFGNEKRAWSRSQAKEKVSPYTMGRERKGKRGYRPIDCGSGLDGGSFSLLERRVKKGISLFK